MGTKRILGRVTASQIAAASAAPFLPRLPDRRKPLWLSAKDGCVTFFENHPLLETYPRAQLKGQRVTNPDRLSPQARFFVSDCPWLDKQASVGLTQVLGDFGFQSALDKAFCQLF